MSVDAASWTPNVVVRLTEVESALLVDQLLKNVEVASIRGCDLQTLRQIGKELREIEAAVSFYRRMVQGWLDIAQHARGLSAAQERQREDLVETLKKALSEKLTAPDAGHPWSYPTAAPKLSPGALEVLKKTVSSFLGDQPFGESLNLRGDELTGFQKRLKELEHVLSSARRELHAKIDEVQEELVRRVREGTWSYPQEVLNDNA